MFEIKITASTLAELAGKTLALAAQLSNTAAEGAVLSDAPPAEDPKPRKARATKAAGAPQAETVQADAAQADAAQADAKGGDTPEEAKIDYQKDLVPAVLKLVGVKGKPAAEAILTEFGAAKASDVPEKLWPELLERLRAEVQ